MFHIGEKQFQCNLCQKSFCSESDLSLHNITAAHLNMLHAYNNTVKTSASTSFIDCGETNIKIEEITKGETLDEDPLSVKKEAENVEETIKQEIEEGNHDKDSLSCEHKSDGNRIKTIDIVEHKIEIY